MNLRKVLCLAALAVALLFVAGLDTCDAHEGINPWGRPTYSGYPAYGYQYHNVHHHHYVYRPHYHHWHPAGWGNHGPYGGWYGGGFIWHGPGNCDACYDNNYINHGYGYSGAGYAAGEGGSTVVEEPGDDDVPSDPIQDLVPELPELP